MEKDLRPYLAHIFINFSKRSVKLVDDEGYEQNVIFKFDEEGAEGCLLYTSPSPRDMWTSRMPSSA